MHQHESDYHQLNSGAHRKTSLRVQAPALTCHLGFWLPQSTNSTERDAVKRDIDRSILKTIAHIRQSLRNNEKIIFDNAVDGKLIMFLDCFNESDLTEYNDEFFRYNIDSYQNSDTRNIHFYVNVSEYDLSFSYDLHTEYVTVTIVVQSFDVNGYTDPNSDLFKDIKLSFKSISQRLSSGIDIKDHMNALYIDFWRVLFHRFCIYDQSDANVIMRSDTIFADFRGLLISDETRTFRDQTFWRDELRSSPDWADASIDGFQGIIGNRSVHEVTASYMLAGRVLYLTNLGPQLPQSNASERIPTRFVLYVHQKDLSAPTIGIVNKWQLGRLVDRLHWLGIHRLAALKNLAELRKASQIIAGLDKVVQNQKEKKKQVENLNRESLLEVQKQLEAIPGGIIGGIQYRTGRSRYYVSNFRRMVSSLRIIRVEGYQPYDLFIENRLGSAFSFIDQLGVRYERALSRLTRLGFNATLEELISIQKIGEIALFGGILPYYLSHLAISAGIFLRFDAAEPSSFG